MVQIVIDPVIPPVNDDGTESNLLNGGDPPSIVEVAAKTTVNQPTHGETPVNPPSFSLEDLKAILQLGAFIDSRAGRSDGAARSSSFNCYKISFFRCFFSIT